MRPYLFLVLFLAPFAPVAAQVGYLPTESPYHEIVHGSYIELAGGHVYGGGGLLQLGPRDGSSESIHYTLRARNTIQFSFGGWTAGTERTVIDANDSIATRNKGLFPERLIAGEIGIQMNVTGNKTWHHLSPFAGVSFGVVHGAPPPAIDTSGYSFGTKLYFAPTIGTRLFIGQDVYLRLDLRGLFWKLDYPTSYTLEPSQQPGTTSSSNAVNKTGVTDEYTATPELRLGIGIRI